MSRPKLPGCAPKSRIGIIAGSGPEAGIDLWQKVLEASRERLGPAFAGDLDAPDVVVISESGLGRSMELAAAEEEVWACLERCLHEMAGLADCYAIACNTLHYFAPRIAALDLPSPLISVVDAVERHLRQLDGAEVTLLGAADVMGMGRYSAYAGLARRHAIRAPAALIPEVHELIYAVKREGGRSPAVVERFAAILARIPSPVVLLACTELPLIPAGSARHCMVDASRLLARELAACSGIDKNFASVESPRSPLGHGLSCAMAAGDAVLRPDTGGDPPKDRRSNWERQT